MERYLRVNLLGPGPRLIKKKRIYRTAVSQRLRNTVLDDRTPSASAANLYKCNHLDHLIRLQNVG